METYKIKETYNNAFKLEFNDKTSAINKLRELEESEYKKHLDYEQKCADNYERSADYYPTYYILAPNGNLYDITNYYMLERGD